MISNKSLLVSVKNVGVEYNLSRTLGKSKKFSALEDVSLDIFEGESIGIIGSNGAGKSTLLRLLAGVIRPNSGLVTFNCRHVGLLSLQVGFNDDLSGLDNIMLSGMLMGFTKNEVKLRLNDIAEYSELGDFLKVSVKKYSHGMRARLGFSIAIQMSPDLLLIDEILGVGDAKFREKSSAAIKDKINSDQTVVLVSHQSTTIKNLCRRAVWVRGGRSVMDGGVGSVIKAYEDVELV